MQLSSVRLAARRIYEHRLLRPLGIGMLGLAGAAWFATFLNSIYPLKLWLFFHLAKIWLYQVLLSAALVSAGHLLLTRALRWTNLPGLQTLSLSAGLGAVLFGMGMYAGGFLGLFRPWFGIALPTVMLLVGLPVGIPRLRASLAQPRVALSRMELVAIAFGTLCIGVLYLGILSPDSLNYDASWNHVVIAQDYARERRIVPFLADWVKNVPHLGSIFNTWAFLVPGFEFPALRWMMALHDEFTFFLWTLVGVAAVVRTLLEEIQVRGTWAAFFLFPAIFVYDSSMGAAADHFLAFFVPPLFLAALHALDRLDVRAGIATGALAAGCVLTKLQAVYILAPLTLAFVVRVCVLAFRRARGNSEVPALPSLARGLVAIGFSGVLLASPHFVKNWVFYKNPLYPMAQGYFTHSTPGIPDAPHQMKYLFADWTFHPPAALGKRLQAAAEMVFTFSFKPHYSFIHDLPMFGSLFTLSLAFLPLLPRARKLWFGAFVGAGAVFVWALTFWVDRNLQVLQPLLAAVTAAILIRAWSIGWPARIGVGALVATQLAWGGDFYFSGNDRIANAVSLIKSGIDGRAKERFDGYRQPFVALGEALPSDATVLLHRSHSMLGIDRRVFLDWEGFQGLVDYRTFATPRDFYDRLREVGVTHIVTAGSAQGPSLQTDIIFDLLATQYVRKWQNFGGLRLASLPRKPPPVQAPLKVLSIGVGGYENGVYPIRAVSTSVQYPPRLQKFARPEAPLGDVARASELLPEVDVVALGAGVRLPGDGEARLRELFKRMTSNAAYALHARRKR